MMEILAYVVSLSALIVVAAAPLYFFYRFDKKPKIA